MIRLLSKHSNHVRTCFNKCIQNFECQTADSFVSARVNMIPQFKHYPFDVVDLSIEIGHHFSRFFENNYIYFYYFNISIYVWVNYCSHSHECLRPFSWAFVFYWSHKVLCLIARLFNGTTVFQRSFARLNNLKIIDEEREREKNEEVHDNC